MYRTECKRICVQIVRVRERSKLHWTHDWSADNLKGSRETADQLASEASRESRETAVSRESLETAEQLEVPRESREAAVSRETGGLPNNLKDPYASARLSGPASLCCTGGRCSWQVLGIYSSIAGPAGHWSVALTGPAGAAPRRLRAWDEEALDRPDGRLKRHPRAAVGLHSESQ
jgi:hypothetical protein